MQTRCWDEKIFVSFHLLLTAFPEDVWKQTRLLLPRLENFKSPSEKTEQKPRSVLCCGEWASFLLPWNRRPCLHSHCPRLAIGKNRNRPLDLANPALAGWIWTCSYAVLAQLRFNVYVNLKARLVQREDAETAIYVSRVTTHQRSQTDWNKFTEEHNTNEYKIRMKWCKQQ